MQTAEKKLVHYEGALGTFDYDPSMYSIYLGPSKGRNSDGYNSYKDFREFDKYDEYRYDYLHFNTNYVGPIILPKGCIDTHCMFENCAIKDGCYFADFDMSDVLYKNEMFRCALVPESVIESNNFDLSGAILCKQDAATGKKTAHYEGELGTFDYDPDMYKIYYDDYIDRNYIQFDDNYVGPISFPKGCTDAAYMFLHREIKSGCYFDDFDTTGVEDMSYMFCGATLPDKFTLGNKFDTSSAKYMHHMFSQTTLPNSFTLGDKFNTTNAKRKDHMFEGATFTNGRKVQSINDVLTTSTVCCKSSRFNDVIDKNVFGEREIGSLDGGLSM